MGIKEWLKRFTYKTDIVGKETIAESFVTTKKDYLLVKIKNVYIGKFYTTHFDFAYEDIYQHILLLRKLNSYDIEHDYMLLHEKPPTVFVDITISDWFTIDGCILNNSLALFKEWIELSEQLVVKYNNGINNISNSIHNGNAVRLQPYIIHIEHILEVLLKCV